MRLVRFGALFACPILMFASASRGHAEVDDLFDIELQQLEQVVVTARNREHDRRDTHVGVADPPRTLALQGMLRF